MSEKIYAWLLRLYSPHFREKYGDAALQLFRDRHRNERGVLPRLQLWRDIVADLVISAPRERSHAQSALTVRQHAGSAPLFQIMEPRRLPFRALFIGGVFSLFVLGACIISLDVRYGYLELIGGCYSGTFCGSSSAAIFRPDWSALPLAPVHAQQLISAEPAFEVAMLRLANPARQGKGVNAPGQIFNVMNYTLKDFIEYAYVLHSSQIVGGPNWLDRDAYDLIAKLPAPRPTGEEMRHMTQAVLADRFKLKSHRERKELPIYILMAGKNGSKLRERHPGDGGPAGSSVAMPNAPRIPGRNASMERLAAVLQVVLDRPVLDRTELTGLYDFDVHWAPDEHQFDGRGGRGMWRGAPDDPDIVTAIQEQLGLRLESQKAEIDVLAIDAANKPKLD
jgi:uncharacterized protein (TIGR03435 family)